MASDTYICRVCERECSEDRADYRDYELQVCERMDCFTARLRELYHYERTAIARANRERLERRSA